MTDGHLLNTIKYVQKAYSKLCDSWALSAYAYAGSTGGEMASYYAEQEADNLMEESWNQERIEEEYPLYKCLLKEAEKRKLDV